MRIFSSREFLPVVFKHCQNPDVMYMCQRRVGNLCVWKTLGIFKKKETFTKKMLYKSDGSLLPLLAVLDLHMFCILWGSFVSS